MLIFSTTSASLRGPRRLFIKINGHGIITACRDFCARDDLDRFASADTIFQRAPGTREREPLMAPARTKMRSRARRRLMMTYSIGHGLREDFQESGMHRMLV